MRLRRDTDGQAMAEFALVLPMLALVTFGTIEVTLWLQQQSALNAAAFMAARSASVLGGDLAKTRQALQGYADASPPWLGQAVTSMKPRAGVRGKETAGFDLTAGADRFTGLISALTGGDVKGFDTLSAGATLPMEYTPKRHKGNLTGEKARFMFEYRVVATEQAVKPGSVAKVKTAIADVKAQADKFIKIITAITPPVVVPSTPPSTGGSPKPGPKPGPKPAPKPVPKPPAPPGGTAADLAKLKQAIPALNALKADGEMFNAEGAVVENPNDHGRPNAGKIPSLQYLSPKMEQTALAEMKRGRVAFCAEGHVAALDNARSDLNDPKKLNLEKTCDQLRNLIDLAKKSQFPVAKGAAVAFEQNAGRIVGALEQSFKTDYDKSVGREAKLFGGR